MATITLEYDEDNIAIKKALELLIALGAKVQTPEKAQKKRVSKTWEAMQKYKGSLIVNDPKFLL